MIVETTTFRLAPDTALDAFLAADARVQADAFHAQVGFLRRTTARGVGDAAGEWVCVTLWGSDEEAAAGATRIEQAPAWAAFVALVDEGSVRRASYETLD